MEVIYNEKELIITVLALSLTLLPAMGYALEPMEKQSVKNTYEIEKELASKQVKKPTRKKATKIFHDAHKKLDMTYKEIIFEELRAYEQNNPSATEDQVNDFFMDLSEKYRSETSSNQSSISPTYVSDGFYEYINGKVQLNYLEQALYDSNPSKGFKAIVAGDEAKNYTLYKFGYNGRNDRSDAFRHEAWNIWIMGYIDYNWAYDWTTAHEEGDSKQPALEKEMDLNNNSIGRIYGLSNNISPDSSVTSTRATIVSAYKSGQLKAFNSSGTQLVSFTGTDKDFINTNN